MSLRSFLNQAEDVNKISSQVEPEFEPGSLASQDQSKPIVFNNIKDYPDLKLVSNLASSRELIANSLGVKRNEILFKLSEAFKSLQECEESDESIDNYQHFSEPDIEKHFPVLKYYSKEDEDEVKAPKYLASCMVVAKDPENDVQNLSFHRMMYHSKNKFTIRIVPRHLYEIKDKVEGDLEVVIIRGVDPRIELAGATSGSPDMNEFEYANSLMNGGLELMDIDGFKIPAETEMIMKGKITSKEDKEGPFVDLSETWDKERQQPIFEVNDLYMKEQPYMRFLVPGKNEHKHLMGLPQEPRIYNKVRETVPTVKNVVISKGGCSWLHGVVQIKKRNEGDAKNAGMAALAGHPSMKKVTVVDEDIDPSKPEEVEWATATRMQPDKDIVFIERAKGSSLDPSQDYKNRLMTKWIVDATIPFEGKEPEEFERAKLPKEDEINLEDYR